MLKSFENRDGWIWMNGKIIPWQDANSHVISQGLHYASAVFEGERAYNVKIFKSEQHTKRFFKSAEIIGMEIPFTHDQINKAKYELIDKMNYKNCYVRPLAWRGGDQMGLSTTKSNINVAIAVWDDWATYFKIEDQKAGLKLITSPWKRPAPDTIPWDTKASGLYMICTLSKHEAERDGYTDSLMLDHEGNVAEATGANIFFKDKDGNLHTPIPDSFLDGITRRTVIDIAKSKNIKVIERKITPDELKNFTGCFLTGTAAEVTPVSQIANYNFKVCKTIIELSDSYQLIVRKKKAA